MESPYWTTKEVYTFLGISRETLRRWRRDLGFPQGVRNSQHPRGAVRFLIAEVLAWDAKRRSFRQQRPPEPSDEAHPDGD